MSVQRHVADPLVEADGTSGQPTAAPPSGRRASSRELVQRYGLALVFLLVVLGFSLAVPDTFPTIDNAKTIAETQAVVALLALAAMLPLLIGQFDVSVAFQLGLSQTLCAGLIIKSGWPAGPAMVAAIAACVAVGAVNGLLVTRLRINSFVATLGVGTVVLGLTQMYGNDETISGSLPGSFTDLGRVTLLGVPLPFVYVAIAAAVLWMLLEYTSWGRACHATGGSPLAAELAGIQTKRVTVHCFLLAGLLSGLAGVLSVMILGASSPTVGLGELLPAFAAAFLGATAIRPGHFNSLGTVLSIYLLAAGITGLQMLGAEYYVQQLFNGAALLIGVSLSALSARSTAP